MRLGQSISGKSQRSGELLAQQLYASGIRDVKVLQAIANTPRHTFVPEILAHKAYDNTALPIGQGQTISQPYIVAKMTELILADNSNDNVLEIGTG
ncbi:MAG: protein-L-isoaspartate O-methyltransferase, partial [Thalassotalea sp.]|nr:protein-L-isoaspartate O-methyltransferase [Thalassotalea sp.]